MSRSPVRGVSGRVRSVSTRRVEHRPTEPRVGSSNLSGRAARSENSNHSEFIAAIVAAGVPRPDARRVIAAFRINAYRAALGRISTRAAVRANEALLCRVLAAHMPSLPRQAVAA